MEEVDIDNMEDLNELEARLYAQIHHEPTSAEDITQLFQNGSGSADNVNTNNNGAAAQTYDVPANTNKNLSRRYWAGIENDESQRQQELSHNQQLFILNPFKTPIQHKQRTVNQRTKYTEIVADKVLNPLKDKQKLKSSVENSNQTNADVHTEDSSTLETGSLHAAPSPSANDGNKQNKNVIINSIIAKQNQPVEESNLKLNPIADWMKRKKSTINKKSNGKSSSMVVKQSLFSRQQQKLERAKRIEEKKKRSRKAKNSAAMIANNVKPTEIIDLDSDNESVSSDVIIIPTVSPPTFTVDDSDDEIGTDKVNVIMEQHEENAVDSTDVQLSSSTARFIKPKEVSTHSLMTMDSDEKRFENSSRCTSPCSIQSSDDFIRNIDRVRLISGDRAAADDEDLLELTSDVNILVESSDITRQNDDDNVCMEKSQNPLNYNQQDLQEKFATPKSSKAQSSDYRVDESQFKALDVYESESDITDSVYSKGVRKSTVIRQIDSSSDDIDDISTCSQRTKRLRKRRASSSNKESDPNNEHLICSTDSESNEDDNKLLRTPVPYIAKGLAVERYKTQKRKRAISYCSSHMQKSKSPKTDAVSENLSDTEFLATLNNLAHGQDEEQDTQNIDKSEESETENVPTAREIAEKILSQRNTKTKINETFTDDMALPDDILNDLDEVFETIDQLDRQKSNSLSSIDDAVKISDSSDSDREKHLIYPTVPNEDAQIIKYSPKNAVPKTHDENGSPIYNVIYSRGYRKAGGIGWNDEMRKFYNDSWNGEHFNLSKVLQNMNPEKNLWKIYTEDRFNIRSNKRNNIKCNNCCEFGHKRSKCRRPRRPLICYMCGESGHCEPRCPNTICLRCGNKTQVFTKSCNACSYQNRLTCPVCKMRGHSLDYCPDKWRRYHSTTEANVHPDSKVDYNPRKYCCICGGRGHISDICRSAMRFSEYPTASSSIKSHQKSYSDVVVKTPYNGIALNLMYEPCEEYNFDLVDQTSLHKYYGRFLKAVGLDFLLRRKRCSNSKAASAENPASNAKKAKRLSKKYEANPYLKVATANRKNNKSVENIPNQVQEVTESGNNDQHSDGNCVQKQLVDLGNEVIVNDNEEEVTCNIQLYKTNEEPDDAESYDKNFKSPKVVTTASPEKPPKPQMEPSLILDSDSNYSFSEHFDVASSTGNDVTTAAEGPITTESQTTENLRNNSEEIVEQNSVANISRPKARAMEALPDFIPLTGPVEDQSEENHDINNLNSGISRKFVAAESDDDDIVETRRKLSPLPELPCEAKIYLTHFHSKYLLSPQGDAFLVKTSRAHKLKARLDFTSVGHVLVIFGFPSNQDNFQRELLLKYRELEDELNQKQVLSSINVPKRTFVLIKFLRENITQLMNNLGNANHLLNRLQFLERQQTKSGFKSAEKVRRSLNMILVGQAGLKDGTMHLDKLLLSLKTLLNDVTDALAPPELRSEIIDHWKVIFSAYRHDNYSKLVETYNKLISKNRLQQINIDPVLLGQKMLDTSLSEEQKQNLEKPKMQPPSSTELANQKNTKNSKPKQNTETGKAFKPSTADSTSNANKAKTTTLRADNASVANVKKKLISGGSTSTSQGPTKVSVNASTPDKTKISNATFPTSDKIQHSSSTSSTSARAAMDDAPKKQSQKQTGPSPLSNPEKRSTVSTSIQKMTDNWKSTCETLLTQISSDTPADKSASGKAQDSKVPSPFWSRESMRYLDDCIRLASARCDVVDRLQRVENKSRNGQLSYNDYLAVIKLHTALNGK